MEHLFDIRPERPGYRLHKLEVFNWGTFDSTDGNIFRFEPQGRTSLLVGHNGTGKSTLVDAILTLLVDGRTRNYNVASGAHKKERNLKSYIKGAYNRTADESQSSIVNYLRPKANHITAISAVFRDEQLNKAFTLTQVLYLKADGSEEKVYAIADSAHELKDDLQGLVKSEKVRDHLKNQGYQTTKTYVEYHHWLKKRTGMQSKAIDMFNETVAVKDIQSLNKFIREHMLEPLDWQTRVKKLLTHFNDLSIAYQELVDARRSEELLLPIDNIGKRYRKQSGTISQLEQLLQASESFFPAEMIRIFKPEIVKQKINITTLANQMKRFDNELVEVRDQARILQNEIDHQTGARLKQIPGLINIEKVHLQQKKQDFERFHDALKTCRIKTVVGNQVLFEQVSEQLLQIEQSSVTEIEAIKVKQEQAIGTKAALQLQLRSERHELEVLEKRRTNLPARFTAMRSQICADLNLDENVLPFAAELISVASAQQQWESSVEMVLRPLALSLLVPDRYYARVRAYVESNRMADAHGAGQKLDYICIGKISEQSGDRIAANSLYNKLQFKPKHDLSQWVRGEVIRRFDFQCCNSVEEFQKVQRYAVTKNRHIKFNAQRHQKDDRERSADPRHFVLGWDNTEKKRRIAEKIVQLETEKDQVQQTLARLDQQSDELRKINIAVSDALRVTEFDRIDLKRHQDEIAELEKEKKQLEESNQVVKQLQARLKATELQIAEISDERDLTLNRKDRLERNIEQVEKILGKAQAELQLNQEAGRYQLHQASFETLRESLGAPALTIENFDSRKNNWLQATHREIDKRRKPLQNLNDSLLTAMSKYLREFNQESDDLDASISSLESFLGLLDQLRKEDLPRHEKKFKNRLNDQVSQEVAQFTTALNQERKQIEGKINQLNKALADVEYSPGTFMKLVPQLVKDREIEDFRRSLNECLDDTFEQSEQANEARYLRIQKLVERLSQKDKTSWRNKVIDVRNWYNFTAQQIDRLTKEMRSCYDGSSGQSGGEKAKLAFTILVAALAYQFDIDPNGANPGRFQFVVIDEMFSRVDDQNAKYALELFKQFGLQILIVAPLDAKARITEPFVDRYIQVVKNSKTNRSQIYTMSAQDYDKVIADFTGNRNSSGKRLKNAK